MERGIRLFLQYLTREALRRALLFLADYADFIILYADV
ncbi:MAG: hypothetical protein J07HQX50_02230 [Haloquadratum sp. J07HQX50]|nr:MAG: hypothetical protein J07HQX50_02230 [Haloquadratum sp. J07HQX50]